MYGYEGDIVSFRELPRSTRKCNAVLLIIERNSRTFPQNSFETVKFPIVFTFRRIVDTVRITFSRIQRCRKTRHDSSYRRTKGVFIVRLRAAVISKYFSNFDDDGYKQRTRVKRRKPRCVRVVKLRSVASEKRHRTTLSARTTYLRRARFPAQ